jgi:hypothetical protein
MLDRFKNRLNYSKLETMKRLLFILAFIYTTAISAQCLNCPNGITAPGAGASPSVKFNGYTSEVKYYDGIKPTCYTPTANTLNGHLQGINNRLCQLKTTIDSLRVNDSSAFAQIDSIQNRIDSIVDALGQFYNTSVISSDSSVRVTLTTNLLTRVNTFNLKVMDDSVGVTALNAISGNGQSYNPLKWGGALTENTTISGDKELNINPFILRLTQNNPTTTYQNLFELRQIKNYTQNSDFTSSRNLGLEAEKKSVVSNGTFNLQSLQTSLQAHTIAHTLKLNSSSILLKTSDTASITYGDVNNLSLTFDGQQTTGGHITSMNNLVLTPIYNGTNTLPMSVYKYTSLALMDLTQQYTPDPSSWVVPTDRYAIYQEGETDKVWLNSEIIVLPNLPIYANDAAAVSDTAFPSGGLYKTTGSVALKVKP